MAAWSGQPDKVCLGGQKNFQNFMQKLKEERPPAPDQTWFKQLIAKAILYRAVERTVKSMKFPAYSAQITAYVVAALSHRTGGRFDFDRIWTKQVISPELVHMAEAWAPQIDKLLRAAAGQRNPSESFKKKDCWTGIQGQLPALTDPLPPELSYVQAEAAGTVSEGATGARSVDDYHRIERCMAIPSSIWMEVAEHGQQAGVLHWTEAGICRTMAGYAAGGWVKKPSIKQAHHGLKAVVKAQEAGLVKNASPVTDLTAHA